MVWNMDPFFKIIKTTFASLNSFINEVEEIGCLERSSLSFKLHTSGIDDVHVFVSYSNSFKKLCNNLQDILKELDTAVFMSSNKTGKNHFQEPAICGKNNADITFQEARNLSYCKDAEYKGKKQKEIKNKIEAERNQISVCDTQVSLNHLSSQEINKDTFPPTHEIQCLPQNQNMQCPPFGQDTHCPPSNLVIPFQNLAIDAAVEEPSINNLLGGTGLVMQSFAPPASSIEASSGAERIVFDQGESFGGDVNLSLSSSFSTAENNNFVILSNKNVDVGSTQKCNMRTDGTRARTSGAKASHRCAVCGRAFRTQKYLSAHLSKVHRNCEEDISACAGAALPFYCCATCHSATNNFTSFQAHTCRPSDHSQSSVPKRILISNLRQLEELKKFICAACGVEFRSLQRISYHLPRCHPGPYPCDICSTNFSTRRQLNYHKKKEHRDQKCFICEECGKQFMRKSSLRKHCVNRHEAKAFTDSSRSEEVVSFECDSCPKKFIKKIFLTNHKLRMHDLDKMFSCQVCDRKFLTNNSLLLHMDIHKGEKKFGCKYCDKRFRRKEKMLLHERIHTGERPFECGRCCKSFVSKARLNEHVRRHDAEKRFPCSHCDKTYAAAFDLKKHTLKKHNLVMNTQNVKVTLKKLVLKKIVGSKSTSTEQIIDDPLLRLGQKEQLVHHPQPHQLTSSSTIGGLVDGILLTPTDHRQDTNTLHHLASVAQMLTDPEAAPNGVVMENSGEHINTFTEPLMDQRGSLVLSQPGLQTQIVYHQPQGNHLQEFTNP